MKPASLFDPATPIRDLLARFPHLRSALAAHRLDLCCGAERSLSEACASRGLAVPEVLEDLESAHRAVEAHSIVPPTMSIREIRRRFPATIPVFERYGLSDCGGSEGPDEPVAWFATVHQLPLEELLREIREAASRDAAARPPDAAPTSASRPFSPHFILGSLFLTLTLGATTGAINLLRIAAGGDVPISHRQIHGHTQILGFAALFLMGIAFHALPRILGIGGRPAPAARPAFWLMFLGVILRNVGQPLGFYPAGRMLSLLSAAMQLASGLLFAWFVFGLLARLREGKYDGTDPIVRFVRAGTVYFVAALLFVGAQGFWLAGHPDAALPFSLTEPFYLSALYGFLLAWIYGFGNRVVSLFLGVGPARKATPEMTLVAQAAGVVLLLTSSLPFLGHSSALMLRDAGLSLAAISALVYLAGNGFLWRRSVQPAMRVPGSPTFAIRAAFACLGLWALLSLGAVLLSRFTALPAQNLWWTDAARHVFTIGFVTLLIVGMSFRILPVFSGRKLWSPALARATYALLLGGAALRLLQYPAAFRPVFYEIGAFMGIPVVVALLAFAFNLIRTMKGAGKPAASPPPASRPRFSATLPALGK
jgi:iron-sulfur cluster repair protein YtfE (RIC family)